MFVEGRQNLRVSPVTFHCFHRPPAWGYVTGAGARGARQRSQLKLQGCLAVRTPAERRRGGETGCSVLGNLIFPLLLGMISWYLGWSSAWASVRSLWLGVLARWLCWLACTRAAFAWSALGLLRLGRPGTFKLGSSRGSSFSCVSLGSLGCFLPVANCEWG